MLQCESGIKSSILTLLVNQYGTGTHATVKYFGSFRYVHECNRFFVPHIWHHIPGD
jgi:hypothetical protein